MKRNIFCLPTFIQLLFVAPLFVAGCGKGAGIQLSEAGGIVKFKGAPLAGANVTFVPENGPVAIGTTDMEGKFKLTTGTDKGAKVGKCNVSIEVPQPEGEAITDTMELTKMMGEGKFTGKNAKKSMIPEKYGKASSSGLSFTVESDSSKNNFTIELE